MSRISDAFRAIRADGHRALVAYLTAGDPSLDATCELLVALQQAGADIIEIGVPFSDPTADGPTIQRASMRALQNGTTLEAILDMVEQIRPRLSIPLVLFGYFNPIMKFGVARFSDRARCAGVDGILVVDLPFEEAGEMRRYTDRAGIDFINLISPVSAGVRLQKVVKGASGFLYYISVTGVTGARDTLPDDLEERISAIRNLTDLPVTVGFGIADPQTARRAGAVADGVVVGSALVSIIERNAGNREELLSEAGRLVSALKAPLRSQNT